MCFSPSCSQTAVIDWLKADRLRNEKRDLAARIIQAVIRDFLARRLARRMHIDRLTVRAAWLWTGGASEQLTSTDRHSVISASDFFCFFCRFVCVLLLCFLSLSLSLSLSLNRPLCTAGC